MSERLWNAFWALPLLLAGSATAGVVFDNSPVRTTAPNGFVMYNNFGAADDVLLAADAVVAGGRLWTWEEVGIAAPSVLNYAFWPDADVSSALPTEPGAGPLPGGSGAAVIRQRNLAGSAQVIGGVEYQPYEYLFDLEQAIGLPASTPLWLSFNVPAALTGPVARYLWAYSGNPSDSVTAWGTAHINDDSGVDWTVRASSGTAFVLVDQSLIPPLAVPLPSPMWLLLAALAPLALRRAMFPEERR